MSTTYARLTSENRIVWALYSRPRTTRSVDRSGDAQPLREATSAIQKVSLESRAAAVSTRWNRYGVKTRSSKNGTRRNHRGSRGNTSTNRSSAGKKNSQRYEKYWTASAVTTAPSAEEPCAASPRPTSSAPRPPNDSMSAAQRLGRWRGSSRKIAMPSRMMRAPSETHSVAPHRASGMNWIPPRPGRRAPR